MMNKLIELKNLTKNFDDQQVLRGINLDIYGIPDAFGTQRMWKDNHSSNHCRL